MKKVLLSVLSLVAVAALAITGTVAYLTWQESDVNVMTLGNVKIEQVEYERDENGNLVDFTQAKPAYPAVGTIEWANEGVEVNGVEYKVFSEDLKNVVDKIVTVNNIGISDAYVRTLVAIEAPEGDPNNLIHINYNTTGVTSEAFVTDIEGVTYYVMSFVYNEALAAGAKSAPSLMQVFLDSITTNEDCAKFGDVWDIKVISQAVQTKGFDNAKTALDAGFGEFNAANVQDWFGDVDVPAVVDNAEELREAMANGGEIILAKDIKDFDADATVTVPADKSVNLNLNGHKITAVADGSGSNREMFLVKGNMTVENGEIELTATQNQGWGAMATVFDVTSGGVLKVDGVTANVSGTDMNFFVHLNNWGSATLEMTNCDIATTYVAVRAFNSGYDMNTVTIKDTDFHNGRMFWVHNYTAEGKDDSTLTLDIYGNNNTSDNAKPVRFGFSNEVYYDMSGKLIP
ncbi:MAG: hypothetical protein J6R33_02380 [Clostridia bacterium]|nr:hypothetical protein [Clostridia bacterium]